MNKEELDSLLSDVQIKPEDPEAVRSLARVVGATLPNRNLAEIHDLARRLRESAKQLPANAKLALVAISTVATSFTNEVAAQRSSLDIGMLAERQSLITLLKEMAKADSTKPSELAEAAGISRAEVSKRLAELRVLGLCEVRIDPNDSRSRPHALTENGAIALVEVEKHRADTVAAAALSRHVMASLFAVENAAVHSPTFARWLTVTAHTLTTPPAGRSVSFMHGNLTRSIERVPADL